MRAGSRSTLRLARFGLASLGLMGLFITACAAKEHDQPSSDSNTTLLEKDSGPLAEQGLPQPACTYPSGPYGSEVDDIVENIKFDGYADADFLCKPAAAMKMDLSEKRTLSFKDFYCSSTCPDKKRRLLWVIVSAGWCGPCQDEVMLTQNQYELGAIDPRVHLMDIIYETDKATPVTDEFAQRWANNGIFQLSFPVAMDPAFRMATYLDRNAVPFNMLIDLDTMQIIFRQTGSNLPAVGEAFHNYLLKK